jgi:hypothetical protein
MIQGTIFQNFKVSRFRGFRGFEVFGIPGFKGSKFSKIKISICQGFEVSGFYVL